MSGEPEGLVFAGSWRDAIPRALIFDPILDAVAVRVYMFLFTQATPGDNTQFPSYDQIGRRLHISRPTVVRAMHLLRATRWVTQSGEVRGADGRYIRNAYLLHDEPLSLAEAIRLDGHYMAYLEGLESHNHPRVRMAASAILTTIYDRFQRRDTSYADPPTVVDRIERRWAADGIGFCAADPRSLDRFHEAVGLEEDDSENRVKEIDSGSHRVKNINPDGIRVKNFDSGRTHRVKDFNSGVFDDENQGIEPPVKKFNPAPSSSSSCSSFLSPSEQEDKKTTTTQSSFKTTKPRAREMTAPDTSHLVFPRHLSPDERLFAVMNLEEFPPQTQQELLDELAGRMDANSSTSRPIRNPIQYLTWMCNQLRSGKTPFTSAGTRFRRVRETEQLRAASAKPQPAAPMSPGEIDARIASLKGALQGRQKNS